MTRLRLRNRTSGRPMLEETDCHKGSSELAAIDNTDWKHQLPNPKLFLGHNKSRVFATLSTPFLNRSILYHS